MKIKLIILSLIVIVVTFFYKQIAVLFMIVGGYFVSPEGSKILAHYCFGNGDTLVLDTQYLQKSPLIIKHAKKLRVNQEIKELQFHQAEDWRLSYAINGFSLKRTKTGYQVKQWIEFDKTKTVYTDLNLGLFKIRIHDDFVHVFDCTPFWVVSTFTTLK